MNDLKIEVTNGIVSVEVNGVSVGTSVTYLAFVADSTDKNKATEISLRLDGSVGFDFSKDGAEPSPFVSALSNAAQRAAMSK